jgi:biotin carboxyl carrier protein
MMQHELSYNDKVFSVIVERHNGSSDDAAYRATIEGVSYNFSALRVSPNELIIFIDGGVRRVYAVSTEDKVLVHIDGHVLAFVKVDGDRETFSREAMEFGARDHVATPMPGKVVKILVKEGERVAARQPLVIVESMKMENEIKSPVAGVIKSIHFGPGDLVEPGKPIIRIEPES